MDIDSSTENEKHSLLYSPQPTASVVEVFRKIIPQASAAFLVFFVTLSIFPGVTSLVQSKGNLGDWFQIIMTVKDITFKIGIFNYCRDWFHFVGIVYVIWFCGKDITQVDSISEL